jgi:hypothetical protein
LGIYKMKIKAERARLFHFGTEWILASLWLLFWVRFNKVLNR